MSLSSFSRALLLFVPWHRQILFPPGKRIIDNESATQKKKKNVNPPPNYSFQFPFFFFTFATRKKKYSSIQKGTRDFFVFFYNQPNNNPKKMSGWYCGLFKCFLGKMFLFRTFLWPSCVSFCVTFWRLTGVTSRKHFSVEPRTFSAPTDEMSSSCLFFSFLRLNFILFWNAWRTEIAARNRLATRMRPTVGIKGTWF